MNERNKRGNGRDKGKLMNYLNETQNVFVSKVNNEPGVYRVEIRENGASGNYLATMTNCSVNCGDVLDLAIMSPPAPGAFRGYMRLKLVAHLSGTPRTEEQIIKLMEEEFCS